MKTKILQKSKYGLKVEGREDWINYGKFYKGTTDFGLGDEVELELNDKYLFSLSVIKKAPAPVEVKTEKFQAKNLDTRVDIARSTAVKAVFGSPILATQYQNSDISQALSDVENEVKRATNFILNGTFQIEPAKTQETK